MGKFKKSQKLKRSILTVLKQHFSWSGVPKEEDESLFHMKQSTDGSDIQTNPKIGAFFTVSIENRDMYISTFWL